MKTKNLLLELGLAAQSGSRFNGTPTGMHSVTKFFQCVLMDLKEEFVLKVKEYRI